VLFLVDVFWVQLLNAAFLAFVFGQTGFIAHDAGHRQGFRSTRTNDGVGLVHGNLLIGMSYGWWLDKHNQHHAHPNEDDLDPDIAIPFIAFSEKDALAKRGILRQFVKYQSILFFPLLLFESLSLRFGSIEYLIREKDWKFRGVEALLLLLHFVWFFAAIFLALPFWQALAFIVIQQALFGFYLSTVFAPNHKGMLVVSKEDKLDYLRQQVLTARNVRAHPITDFWYGGLNYQIEHHLFPGMARNKLAEAQKVIRKFCEEHGVSYYETSMPRSYVEILQYLHQVSAPLRSNQISQSMIGS
jgi:fatty acid desaturase